MNEFFLDSPDNVKGHTISDRFWEGKRFETAVDTRTEEQKEFDKAYLASLNEKRNSRKVSTHESNVMLRETLIDGHTGPTAFDFNPQLEEALKIILKNYTEEVYPRGLWLAGGVGSGKTYLLKSLSQWFNLFVNTKVLRFPITPAHRIVTEFEQHGSSTLKKYYERKVVCIDDMGEESRASYYGTDKDVVTDIIQTRYEMNKHTLVATNLNEDELNQRYGERVVSRMNEMLTKIPLGVGDFYKDYRKQKK